MFIHLFFKLEQPKFFEIQTWLWLICYNVIATNIITRVTVFPETIHICFFEFWEQTNMSGYSDVIVFWICNSHMSEDRTWVCSTFGGFITFCLKVLTFLFDDDNIGNQKCSTLTTPSKRWSAELLAGAGNSDSVSYQRILSWAAIDWSVFLNNSTIASRIHL
jgi:hypothetical protein